MRECMTEKEIDDLVKEIMKFPKVESNNPVSTMYGFDVDTLINTLRDFKRLPTYDEVLKQNQKYKEVIDKAIKFIEDNTVEIVVNNRFDALTDIDSLLDILKEVE